MAFQTMLSKLFFTATVLQHSDQQKGCTKICGINWSETALIHTRDVGSFHHMESVQREFSLRILIFDRTHCVKHIGRTQIELTLKQQLET